MEPTSTPYDVFLSYQWRDHETVERIARELEKRDLRVFLDRWYLTPGLPWRQALEQTLVHCRAIVICIGLGEMGSWQIREVDLALDRQTQEERRGVAFPVIPLLLPGAELPLSFLKGNTWVALRGGEDAQAFETTARAARGLPPGKEAAARPAICPYRGLQFFREEDAPFFFGREAFTKKLIEEVQKKSIIAVVGASGCGKSSVVRAGLIPHLRKVEESGPVWDILTLKPGARPMQALAAAICPMLEPDLSEVDQLAECTKLTQHFTSNTVSFQDAALRCLARQPGTDRLLLFVDQWEELYTECRDEEARRRFIDQILSGISDGPVTVVLTVRGDFYDRALSHRELVDRLQDGVVNLGPMNPEELRDTIEEPARAVGLEFEPGLVDHILGEVGEEPGNLPLLEFMLRELWQERRGNMLHFQAYEEMGGIKGAVARRADAIFENELTDEQRRAARRVLMQLVRPGEGVPDTRRRALLAKGDESALAVVQKLAKARLLVTGREETRRESQAVEIAHEALIRHWKRLQQWVDEDREFLRTRERVESAAGLWEKEEQPDDRLLRPGRPLAEGEDLLAKRRSDLNPALIAFIEASIAAERRRQEAQQEEENRRQAERQNEQRQKLRRRSLLTAAAVAVSLVTIGLGLIAFNRWIAADEASRTAETHRQEAVDAATLAETRKQEAERERNNAVSRALAAQATLLSERGPSEDSLLRAGALAVESWRRAHNAEAHSIAMRLLEWFPVKRIEADPKSPSPPGVVFSPDGRFLAIASSPLMRIIETATGRELIRIQEEKRFLPDVQFSADSRYVWFWNRLFSIEDAIEVFRADAGKFNSHHTLSVSGSAANTATMSPNSRWAALTSVDSESRTNVITIVDLQTGKETCRIEHQLESPEAVMGLAFSPDGTCLVISDYRADTVRLIDVPSGGERTRITKNGARAKGFIRNGQYLVIEASNDSGEKLHFIDTETGHELNPISLRKDGYHYFSSDGQRMVDKKGEEVWLLEVPTGKVVAHWEEIDGWYFDNSGKWLILRSPRGLHRLIDSASGQEKSRTQHKCETSDYWNSGVAVRADEDFLVLACQEGDIRTFVANTGAEAARFKLKGRVVGFSPDARLIATQDNNQEVLSFYESRTGREFGRIATSVPFQYPAAPFLLPGRSVFSGVGRYLAIPSPTGSVQLVDLSRAYNRLRIEAACERPVLSRDRRLLAFAGSDQIIRVADMETGSEVGSFHNNEPTFPRHIGSDGRFLITAQKSSLILNEIESGQKVASLQEAFFYGASPDGNYLDVREAGREGALLESRSLREILRYPKDELCCQPTFSPDGRSFAIANRFKHIIQLFDTASGVERLRIAPEAPSGSLGGPCCPTFSPDGQALAVDVFGRVNIYDISTGVEKLALSSRGGGVFSSTFSPDGSLLAVSGGLHMELYDVLAGTKLASVQVQSDNNITSASLYKYKLDFSGDNRSFATGSAKGSPVRLFEARTGKELARIELGWGLAGVLFSPDGRTLAAASTNGAVRLLDVESLKVIGIGQHAKEVTNMEFSPDSRYLATASADGTALLLATRPETESAVGREIARFEHGAPLLRANFSCEGRSLLTVSSDRIKLWPADPEWPFEQLRARAGRNLTRGEWRTLMGESDDCRATSNNWHTPEPSASAAAAPAAGPGQTE